MNFVQLTQAQMIEILNDPKAMTLMMIMAAWVLVWKGISLWKAARNGSKPWFVALLVINTMGILEILYTFWFSDKKSKIFEKK